MATAAQNEAKSPTKTLRQTPHRRSKFPEWRFQAHLFDRVGVAHAATASIILKNEANQAEQLNRSHGNQVQVTQFSLPHPHVPGPPSTFGGIEENV